MMNDIFTYIIGGKAGEGVKKAGAAAANLFSEMGRKTFKMDDYQSLIRGGHNFSAVSTSTDDVYSHYMEADLIVNLDDRSYNLHKEHLTDDGLIIYNSGDTENEEGIGLPIDEISEDYSKSDLIKGVAGISVLSAVIGLDKDKLESLIEKEYSRGFEENLSFGEDIYDLAKEKIDKRVTLEKGEDDSPIFSGNEALSLGAASAGLDMYIGYPMTPASSILHFFAAHKKDLQIMPIHPENEISVANIAVGATMPGARVMVGSSGGGLALMEETISLAGMSESPVLFVLASRPGPSTGVPTYTEQGDLNFALNQGHGEFPLVVASPGSMEEAFYLAGEMLDILWTYQTPGIFLTEKHLSESSMNIDVDPSKVGWAEPKKFEGAGDYKRYEKTDDGISPLKFPPSEDVIKWNSYENDEKGITTEEPKMVEAMHDKRRDKNEKLMVDMKERDTVNQFGDTGPVIFTYGSTTMSVREAVKAGDIEAQIVQPKYLRPFPFWELEDHMNQEVIVVEQSSTGQFASLLREKCNIVPKTVIRKYDGRPFEPLKLAEKIKGAI
ncbi:MAG: 2-oxoacid:acceptor oxidoreductase subunit alpha [Candidatus Thermoplasmatota archaeon]|nr:2-oxoacid:acceptor oxidoreductase subunit alpha [Candidatus Thermoplasmatota archaeon]MBS3790881.1 2-oxoacid:acceptor oxidoreductase subunit alpha [Candidatus Thermoplasmatota archaeon]